MNSDKLVNHTIFLKIQNVRQEEKICSSHSMDLNFEFVLRVEKKKEEEEEIKENMQIFHIIQLGASNFRYGCERGCQVVKFSFRK